MFFKMEHCDVYYGQIQALYDINVEINPGEIISIIGANGAGKTTLMKSIMGLVPAKNGKIVWQDEEIQAKKTHHIVKRGISYVPEGREIFPGMTVLENMEMGAYTLHMSAKEKADKLNEMYELFPRLYERKKQKAGTLSGGEQGSSNGSPIPDNIADEADAVAARMRASREAYERGLREEQAMIDAHNAGKRSKDNQGKKQEDVRVTGNVLISFSLAGRTFTYMHVPAYQCEGSGQVVVSISVNRNGKVTSASVRSSTSGEECLSERALEAARLSRFNVDASAPASQSGTITYLFQRQ